MVRILKPPLAMYICICNPVTDSQVRKCVREGACTLSDLQMQLGIACQCGACAVTALAIVNEESVQTQSRRMPDLGLSSSA